MTGYKQGLCFYELFVKPLNITLGEDIFIKFLNRFFLRDNKRRSSELPEDIMRVPRIVETLLNKAALDIIDSFRGKLLLEPINYVVPAIWGVTEKGKIDKVQKEIHRQVTPLIHEILDSLDLEFQNSSQKFTVDYLVKGLIIAKITYMIEALKNQMNENLSCGNPEEEDSLAKIEPIGRA
jgi:hypothetical protein